MSGMARLIDGMRLLRDTRRAEERFREVAERQSAIGASLGMGAISVREFAGALAKHLRS